MHYTDLLNFIGNNLVDISARAVEIGSDYNMILVNAPTKDIGTRLLVPAQYVNKENNTILLNIQPHAISPITVANGAIQFSTRFNKVLHDLYIPMGNIIYHEIRVGEHQVHAHVYDWSVYGGLHECQPIEGVPVESKSKTPSFLKVIK